MKKIVPLVLASLFIWQIVGFFGFYQWEKWSIKREIASFLQEKAKDSDFILLSFSKEQLKHLTWLDEKEIMWNGKVFDIITVENTPYGTIYKCFDDERENKFYAKLNQSVDDNLCNSSKKSAIKVWLKMLTSDSLPDKDETKEVNVVFFATQKSSFFYLKSICIKHVTIDAPPPQS